MKNARIIYYLSLSIFLKHIEENPKQELGERLCQKRRKKVVFRRQ